MTCNAILNQSAYIGEQNLIKNLTPQIVKTILETRFKGKKLDCYMSDKLIEVSFPYYYGQYISVNLRTGRVEISYPLSNDFSPKELIALLKPAARQVIALKVQTTLRRMGGKVTAIDNGKNFTQLRVKVGK